MSAHTSAFEGVADLAARVNVLANQIQQTAEAGDAQAAAAAASTSELGRVALYAAAPPASWVRCDGSDLAKAEYADLYDAIGAAYNRTDDPEDTTWDRFRVPSLASVQHQDGQEPSTGGDLHYYVATK